MGFGFTDMTPEGKKYFRELKKLEQREVHVGFQSGDVTYEETGMDLVEVAAANEFGDSNRPARPFMKQSFENHEKELQTACDKVNKVLNSGGTTETALKQLGVTVKGIIQDEIATGEFAPNAESTVARKKSRKPLIDTGTMRQSVNYVIK